LNWIYEKIKELEIIFKKEAVLKAGSFVHSLIASSTSYDND